MDFTKQSTSVLCESQEEYDILMKILESQGFKWGSKRMPTEKNYFEEEIASKMKININVGRVNYISYNAYEWHDCEFKFTDIFHKKKTNRRAKNGN